MNINDVKLSMYISFKLKDDVIDTKKLGIIMNAVLRQKSAK